MRAPYKGWPTARIEKFAAALDQIGLTGVEKVALIESLGFTPGADPHTYDCPRGIGGSGYRCQCVPPATTWSGPPDVDAARGETWEQRVARARARSKREEAMGW